MLDAKSNQQLTDGETDDSSGGSFELHDRHRCCRGDVADGYLLGAVLAHVRPLRRRHPACAVGASPAARRSTDTLARNDLPSTSAINTLVVTYQPSVPSGRRDQLELVAQRSSRRPQLGVLARVRLGEFRVEQVLDISTDHLVRLAGSGAIGECLIDREVCAGLVLGAEHHVRNVLEQIGHGTQHFHVAILVRIRPHSSAHRT